MICACICTNMYASEWFFECGVGLAKPKIINLETPDDFVYNIKYDNNIITMIITTKLIRSVK